MRAFMLRQQKEVEAAQAEATEKAEADAKELAELKAKLAEASTVPPGNEPIGEDDDDTAANVWNKSDAVATWKMKLLEKTTAGLPPNEAAYQVDVENEGLRDAYLAQHALTYKTPTERMEQTRR